MKKQRIFMNLSLNIFARLRHAYLGSRQEPPDPVPAAQTMDPKKHGIWTLE